jgi:diamine N-acetyltransferase
MKTQIRHATPEDTLTIIEIAKNTYKDHFSTIWSKEGLEKYLNNVYSKDTIESELSSTNKTDYIILENDNEIIGFSKLNYNINIPVLNVIGTEIEKIYLKKEYTGYSFGKELIEWCINHITLKCGSLIWLEVLKTNNGAINFYSKNGFTKVGGIPFATDILNIGLDIMVLERST